MWRNQRLASISLNKVIASLGSQKRVGLFLCVSVGITSTAGPVLLVPHQCQGGGGGGGGAGIHLRQLCSPSHGTNKPGPFASFTPQRSLGNERPGAYYLFSLSSDPLVVRTSIDSIILIGSLPFPTIYTREGKRAHRLAGAPWPQYEG